MITHDDGAARGPLRPTRRGGATLRGRTHARRGAFGRQRLHGASPPHRRMGVSARRHGDVGARRARPPGRGGRRGRAFLRTARRDSFGAFHAPFRGRALRTEEGRERRGRGPPPAVRGAPRPFARPRRPSRPHRPHARRSGRDRPPPPRAEARPRPRRHPRRAGATASSARSSPSRAPSFGSSSRKRGVPYREDETNENEVFARNRIRRKVLPEMERKDPGRTARLARAGEATSRRLEALDQRLDEALAEKKISSNGIWPRSFFARLSPEEAGRLLVRAAGAGGRVPGKAQVKKVLSRIERGDRTFGEEFAGGRIEVDPRRVRFVPRR